MKGLTPRQSQILQMIQEFIADSGMPPTRAEIARELGFKSANASRYAPLPGSDYRQPPCQPTADPADRAMNP